ncbi:MAG: hypothetical protein ACRD4E_05680 [Bryobacteraceae bacterium]
MRILVDQQTLRDPVSSEQNPADWTRHPVSALVGWCLPIALGAISSNLLPASLKAGAAPAFIWAAAFAWMGAACLLNARRCHRLHCYFSGPILLGATLIAGLIGFGIVPFGRHGLDILTWITFGLVLLTFVPELIFGRYARTRA